MTPLWLILERHGQRSREKCVWVGGSHREGVYSSLPYPRSHFAWFQLPMVNRGLKVLNGKILEIRKSYGSNCQLF